MKCRERPALLIELNEPEALLESLKRVCQRKVDSFADGEIPPEEAKRWRTAANALYRRPRRPSPQPKSLQELPMSLTSPIPVSAHRSQLAH